MSKIAHRAISNIYSLGMTKELEYVVRHSCCNFGPSISLTTFALAHFHVDISFKKC